MKNNWFIKTSKGQVVGPISELQCKKGIEERRDLTDFFVRQGDSAWKPAKEVLELFRRLEHEGLYIEQAGKIFGPFTEAKFLELVPSFDVTANWRKGNRGIWYPIQPIKANPINYLMQPVLLQVPKTPEVTVPVPTQSLPTQPSNEVPWNTTEVPVFSSLSTSRSRRKSTTPSPSSILLKAFGATLGLVLPAIVVFGLMWKGPDLGINLPFLSQLMKSKPTKAEWLEKVKKQFSCTVIGDSIFFRELPSKGSFARLDDFLKAIGNPDDSQFIGGHRIWYYECSDGTIQLVNEQNHEFLIVLKVNMY
jgi:hypothetical protein